MSTLFAEQHTNLDCFDMLMHELRIKYGETVYSNWFCKLVVTSLEDGVLSIIAPTKFIREWIITNYFSEMKKMGEQYGVKKIDITVHSSSQPAVKNINILKDNISSPLDSNFTFENFVEGKQNKFALNAALSISDLNKVNVEFGNWLYVQGDVGVGKTHLLQAIASRIKSTNNGKRVCYMSAETFTQNYVMSVKSNELIKFRDNVRSIDVLLFDDIQFTCGKVSTQKEFACIINFLMESNKRVVIVSDRSPYALDIDARTKSRLSSFMIAEMHKPGLELRKKIIKQKISMIGGYSFPDDAVSFLAENFTSSAREAEGALRKTVTYCNLNNVQATKEICNDILKSSLREKTSSSSISNIIKIVSDFYCISQDDILSKKRLKNIVNARQVICYLAKELTKLSFQEIGTAIGGKDHATVLYSVKQLERKIKTDTDLCQDLLEIKNQIIAF